MIGIICFWDRPATPYLAKYEKLLSSMNLDYEVLFWNRTPKENDKKICQAENIINISLLCKKGKIGKFLSFIKWSNTVKKILKRKKYDYLIVLSTVPAVLLYSQLMNKYKNKYIFDIRDYTLESNNFFNKIVTNLINQSKLTTISSKGFMRWLDDSPKILVNHNITIDSVDEYIYPNFKEKEKINFAFVGNVRLDTQTEALLYNLKNSKYIEQHFYGRIIPNCKIEEIKDEHSINNIYLHGVFDVSEKKDIFKNVDLINCVYANAEKEKDIPLGDSTPLPNRLYDSIIFYRPIIASKGTYLAELVEEYHLGCSINGFDTTAEEQIMKYVNNFTLDEFVKGCNQLKDLVINEEINFLNVIKEIFSNWK